MTLEKRLSEIIRSRGINLAEMARLTNIPYTALYSSLMDKSRHREMHGWLSIFEIRKRTTPIPYEIRGS